MDLNFIGADVNVALTLTYGAETDGRYPAQAFVVTGISGQVVYGGDGLDVNAPLVALVPIDPAEPTPAAGAAAPLAFSRFAVKTGLPADNHGTLTYDNLYWPNEAPSTAVDDENHGGVLDFYGLMFDIGDGMFVDLWSNGSPDGRNVEYGMSIVSRDKALAYIGGLVPAPAPVPVPASLGLLGGVLGGLAVLGLTARHRRQWF